MSTHGVATNASPAMRFVGAIFGDLSLTDMVASLRGHGEAVNKGDLSAPERMLNSQAVALNANFAELARRAALNMGDHLGATNIYLRLALKAQSQSRATVEALSAIKNPPTVFAKQANISTGGQQQINNEPAPSRTPASARPRETVSMPTELLENKPHGCTQLDPRATPATGGAHPELAPVGELHRAAKRSRYGRSIAQRRERRAA